MQDVENSDQTNESNNEEIRKNCALGNFKKGLKNDLPLVIRASKLAKQK